jgi:hypothetical protein
MTAPLDDLGFSFGRPDTMLGLFDSSGTNLLVENDDGGGETSITIMNSETGEFDSTSGSSDFPFDGPSVGSALRAFVTANGTYYLAVTGYGDLSFAGAHSESGGYALLVGVAAVPEPGGAMLVAIAIVACFNRSTFRRKRRIRAAARELARQA